MAMSVAASVGAGVARRRVGSRELGRWGDRDVFKNDELVCRFEFGTCAEAGCRFTRRGHCPIGPFIRIYICRRLHCMFTSSHPAVPDADIARRRVRFESGNRDTSYLAAYIYPSCGDTGKDAQDCGTAQEQQTLLSFHVLHFGYVDKKWTQVHWSDKYLRRIERFLHDHLQQHLDLISEVVFNKESYSLGHLRRATGPRSPRF